MCNLIVGTSIKRVKDKPWKLKEVLILQCAACSGVTLTVSASLSFTLGVSLIPESHQQ